MRFVPLWCHCCLALPLLLLVGCASSRVDWDSRVGHYSFDQAVSELGTPQRSEVLPDGGRDAEWLVRKGTPRTVGFGPYGSFATPGLTESRIPNDNPATPSQYIHLVFGADNQLTRWRWVSRYDP